MDLVLATLTEAGDLTLEVHGTLALAGAEHLKTRFRELAPRGVARIEIDLARAECITSVGLSALAVVWDQARELGVPVQFANVSAQILKLFEVAGLRDTFLPAYQGHGAGQP